MSYDFSYTSSWKFDPDRAIAKYVYVLRLRNGLWYVGSTQMLASRLHEHFYGGGADATRKSRPVRVEALFAFQERRHRWGGNLRRVETCIAYRLAEKVGAHLIRGAMHGHVCDAFPPPPDRHFVRRTKLFFLTNAGKKLWASVRQIDPSPFLPSGIRKFPISGQNS
ncbi:MAG TPA: GIY-YIG nuclease family protein [Lacunisphaera sp.]|jgi:hypothetical protein|nr:GIY-YIG nuclease family protein [Lacunisphaera sp.]